MIRRRRGAALAVLLAAVAGTPGVAAGAAGPEVPARQPLVLLLSDHEARSGYGPQARRIASVRARRPLTGVRTVLPVLGRATGADGRRWLHVGLPGRPNGRKGWISDQRTRATSTGWLLAVDLSERTLTVHRDGRTERRFRVTVGAPSTPTPEGRFFVEEALSLASEDVGAPFALALSARSTVLQRFAGGPGQIALHGTGNLSGTLGAASSHGCVRLSTAAIRWLAARIGAGVPVVVSG